MTKTTRLAYVPVAVMLLLALLLASFTAVPIQAASADEQATLIVQFQRAAAGPAQARARAAGEAFDLAGYTSELLADHDEFLSDLQAQGISASLVMLSAGENGADVGQLSIPAQWTFAINGMAIEAPSSAMIAIRSMPGVRHVELNQELHALLAESVPYVRAPEVWAEFDARGEGQTIADIDTGIDWTHPSFTNNPALPPGPDHPKVKYYMTYTAGATDDFGHGTHVGATIAGDKDLGYTTGVSSEIDDLGTSLYNGVAPKADLWGYKVLTAAGSGLTVSIVSAIDDAARRGAKVINLSLGSTNDDPNSASPKAVDGAMASGSVVAVAAGNSGPGYSTIGTPATARLALTVGATTDPGDNQYSVVDTTASPQHRMSINLFSNSPVPPSDPPIEDKYVFVGEGCTPLDYAGKEPVLGKIALIKRGTCTFTAKAYLAQEQGADAVLIYNNVSGELSGSMEQTRISVGALSDASGAYLMQYVDTVTGLSSHSVLFDPNPTVLAGQITGFSSRGPTDDYRIKPDVVAPGNTVTAATTKTGVPTASMVSASGYTTAGGTSMATPHVAGASALVRQLHPDWTPFEVKAALMNTARQLTDPADGRLYSIMDQGAGLIDVMAASTAKGLLLEPSHSFGEVDSYGGVVTRKATFRIQDVSGSDRSYKLTFEPGDGKNRGGQGRALPAEGFDVALKPSTVRVPANGEAEFTLTVTVDGAQLPAGDYEGRIAATASDQTLRAPIFYRNVHKGVATGEPPTLTDPGDTSITGDYTLDWTDVKKSAAYRVQETNQVSTVFTDDAEAGLGKWSVGGTAGPAAWSRSSARAHGGTYSFAARQAPDQSNTLTLKSPLSLPAGSAALSFWTYYDTEPTFDIGYVEASRDGKIWTVLGSLDGLSEGWLYKEYDLSAFAGGPVYIRFRHETDLVFDAGFYEGWYVDDVAVSSANWTTLGEVKTSSYQVTGQANGAYYYRVAALFNTPNAKRAQGPWSNVVDITVQRP